MNNDVAIRTKNVTLVDVLDRVLGKGAVVGGDIQLCVADIELVNLKLQLLLSSTATLEKFTPSIERFDSDCNNNNCASDYRPVQNSAKKHVQIAENPGNTGAVEARVLKDDEPVPCFDKSPSDKVNIDPKKVEQGLAKLVLTLVELLRKLMEKQALRRMDLGTLTEKQIDQLGEAFMRLDEKMKELKEVFGLKDEDLNLDLGPVGDLM